jgi:hypothetical protein
VHEVAPVEFEQIEGKQVGIPFDLPPVRSNSKTASPRLSVTTISPSIRQERPGSAAIAAITAG